MTVRGHLQTILPLYWANVIVAFRRGGACDILVSNYWSENGSFNVWLGE